MKNFPIADLVRAIKATTSEDGRQTTDAAQQDFTGVNTDSRTIKVGDCFFAIAGENFDGHDFVADVFAKGAVCAVVSKEFNNPKFRHYLLKVDDTVKALGDFAREYRRRCGFKVVAITGSVGKTTVRRIIFHVLGQHYRVFQSPKNFNNQIGLPLTLLGADPEHQIVVAELGTNHLGEIAYLTGIAQPNIAVVTNIQPAHLEGFGNLQTIAKEKLSIAEGLTDDGILIINDDAVKWLNYQSPITNHKVITFGKSSRADYQAKNITFQGFNSRFTIDGTEIYLPLAGQGNVENTLAAWAVCSQFNINISDFAKKVRDLTAIPMRAEVLQFGELTVLNDCYNANPASMKNALDILSQLDPTQNRRRIFICGDMAELGNQAEQLHIELGNAMAAAKVQFVIAVGKLAKIAAQSAKQAACSGLQIECFDDVHSACNKLHEIIKDNDIILVKGSRIAKLEMAVEKLKELPTKIENRK